MSGGQRQSEGENKGNSFNAFRNKRDANINKQEEVDGHKDFVATKWLLFGLTLIISLAVYINWRFVGEGKAYILADSRTQTKTESDKDVYSSSDTDSYFDNAKYLRKKNYNESVAVLSEIVNNDTTDSETRKLAADTIASYIEISQHEQTIENLISAKGFKDCVVFLNSDNATVVVESDGLTQAQAAQILDTVASETKFPYDVIKIIEIGSVQK